MNRQAWREAIHALPVFDTHTHLNMPDVPIAAQDFWDIAHYFWFQQELWSVGYPLDAAALPEETRVARFVQAFNRTRNTHWHRIVRHICQDLYGVALVDTQGNADRKRVRAVDDAIQARSGEDSWPQAVIDQLAIRRIVVNNLRDVPFPGLPNVGIAIPTWEDRATWAQRILMAADPRPVGEAACAAARDKVAALDEMGIRGMRVAAEPFEVYGPRAVEARKSLPADSIKSSHAEAFLSHALFDALAEHQMFAQLFLGIERDVSRRTSMAVNDPRRITNLYPLFERYECDFELVIGAPQNNMDAAQAARIYPNVHVGGLWWYNFRASTYNRTMQIRAEAVPAGKSAIVASDARCIEWCYGKILLVKWLLADFLNQQVEWGWLTRQEALWLAREWLHDAAARRYMSRSTERG